MTLELRVSEFEALVTNAACCRLKKTVNTRREIVRQFTLIANEILQERLPSLQAFISYRDAKCFLEHKETGRIVCEVAIDGEGDVEIRRPRALLISRKGYVHADKLEALANWASKKGTTTYLQKKEAKHGLHD